ncbi:receptor expression-enhancing protein 1 isoform X3 [Carassius gibelio]|uniref:receptor expression-enhancing protein 1 isoform X3 n=1 Tax=Carassius gibelio TaxID=101364 RepID=UPI0022788944|nr:receptor expression-enhancing protein 1 isoform X3 [Carassius gibelio]
MVSWIISRLVVLIFGTLYPAYSSYKAVKSKDVREYVKWMMYWIIFALFTSVEVVTDIFLCWLPFYYELKIAFVVWLLSPYTKGSSVLYRKFVHPTLSSKEKDIDEYLCQAKDKSYDTLMQFGRKGLNVAATAAVTAATKSPAQSTANYISQNPFWFHLSTYDDLPGYFLGYLSVFSQSLVPDFTKRSPHTRQNLQHTKNCL